MFDPLHFEGESDDGGHARVCAQCGSTAFRQTDDSMICVECGAEVDRTAFEATDVDLGLAGGVITNGHAVALRLNESSIGQHFNALGHRTHAFGKWDVGMTTKYHTPTYRGFDTFVGY